MPDARARDVALPVCVGEGVDVLDGVTVSVVVRVDVRVCVALGVDAGVNVNEEPPACVHRERTRPRR